MSNAKRSDVIDTQGLGTEPKYPQTKKKSAAQLRDEKRQRREKRDEEQLEGSTAPLTKLAPITFLPKSSGQVQLVHALNGTLVLENGTKPEGRVLFGIGPAGTGKTMFCVSKAVDLLLAGIVRRLVLTRPAVEAGEKLGFLPGDIAAKLDPYMRPLYDALVEKLGGHAAAIAQVKKWLEIGIIEIGPLGMLRGRTMKDCVVVADELQNATYTQIKMLMTRIGSGGFMFITGDPEQIDLPEGESGLAEVCEKIEASGKFAVVRLKPKDIQRDPIVADLVNIL